MSNTLKSTNENLTPEQIAAIEQQIQDLRERKRALQRVVTDLQDEMSELGKQEYRLMKLLPKEQRIDHLFV